jgi:hypothetical protein
MEKVFISYDCIDCYELRNSGKFNYSTTNIFVYNRGTMNVGAFWIDFNTEL